MNKSRLIDVYLIASEGMVFYFTGCRQEFFGLWQAGSHKPFVSNLNFLGVPGELIYGHQVIILTCL